MCSAVFCSVGSDVYQIMLFQAGVKWFVGAKFGGAIQWCHETVIFASHNTVRWMVTLEVSKVDSVKCVPFMAVVEPEECLNLNVSYVVLTPCNSSPTK